MICKFGECDSAKARSFFKFTRYNGIFLIVFKFFCIIKHGKYKMYSVYLLSYRRKTKFYIFIVSRIMIN